MRITLAGRSKLFYTYGEAFRMHKEMVSSGRCRAATRVCLRGYFAANKINGFRYPA